MRKSSLLLVALGLLGTAALAQNFLPSTPPTGYAQDGYAQGGAPGYAGQPPAPQGSYPQQTGNPAQGYDPNVQAYPQAAQPPVPQTDSAMEVPVPYAYPPAVAYAYPYPYAYPYAYGYPYGFGFGFGYGYRRPGYLYGGYPYRGGFIGVRPGFGGGYRGGYGGGFHGGRR